VAAYVVGATLAGLAGGLYAHSAGFISPDRFGFATAVDILVFAVIGGTTAFPGAILGAWLITALPELLRFLQDWRTIFNGLVLLGVILFLPNGLLTLGALLPSVPPRPLCRCPGPRRCRPRRRRPPLNAYCVLRIA
jgi:ABC-type branched-subunit amino acid transport system permease subunit